MKESFLNFGVKVIAVILVLGITPVCAVGRSLEESAQQVSFQSGDGHTALVGYLFLPVAPKRRSPAIVLMHGRTGAYSSAAHGDYSLATLRRRDAAWARRWMERGYIALIVDSFGPRGYPTGFRAGTHDDRPSEINEVTVRPLDAYGALAFLKSRDDVAGDRVGLQGWSNGASAVLATAAVDGVGSKWRTGSNGFKAALAFYPGCGLDGRFDRGYQADIPVQIFIGGADEEVSAASCERLAARTTKGGGGVDLIVYPGATHDFDDPGNHRQDSPANVAANTDASARAIAFFDRELR